MGKIIPNMKKNAEAYNFSFGRALEIFGGGSGTYK